MAWATSVGAHWEKIEREYNAEWAKLVYLDGPGYTAWDRIEAKSDLHRRYFSRSSSHGVVNSPVETLTQPVESHFTSPRVESSRELDHGKAELNRQHNSRMAEHTREIRESFARILELLQEEIDATESKKDELPTSEETLPSMEPFDEQLVDDSFGARTTMVESVTPIVCTPLLHQDESYWYPIASVIPKFITRFVYKTNLALQVVDLSRCKGTLIPLSNILITSSFFNFDSLLLKPSHPCVFTPTLPPPPKPPDQSFQKIPVEFQVTGNPTIAPPPPEPPNIGHKVIILNTICYCWRFIVCSEVFIFRVYLSLIACVALSSFSKGVPHILLLEAHDFCIQSITNLNPFVSHEKGVFSIAFDSKNSHVGTAQQIFDEMPEMIVHCFNSLFVEFKIVGILNVKELLSCEFFFNCSAVVVIQFIYEVYDQLRWITCCGCVLCGLISKKRSFFPCFKFVFSQFVSNSKFSWNAHHSSWFYGLNNQGDPCDDYDLTSAYSLGNLKGFPIFKCLNGFELMFLHELKRDEWADGCVKTDVSAHYFFYDVARFVQNFCVHFVVASPYQTNDCSISTSMVLATTFGACSAEFFSHHVLEEAANSFTESQKLRHCSSSGTPIVPFVENVYLGAVLNLTCENEKVLFEYPAIIALEIHLPQCTRNCLDMDWFRNLIFATETTSVAFLHYVQSFPILCDGIKSSCILANDDFSAIIVRLGLLYCVATSNWQWYLNCQCLHFYKINIYNRHSKKWDIDGNGYFFYTKGSQQFQQWDPGGCSLVRGQGLCDFSSYLKVTSTTTLQHYYLGFNLEDKVDFKGDGNVMSLRVRRGIMGNRNMDPYKYEKSQGNKYEMIDVTSSSSL